MKRFILAIVPIVLLTACHSGPIVREADISALLRTESPHHHLDTIDQELTFWNNRILKNQDDLPAISKTASLLCRRYAYSGNVQELHRADSLYGAANNFNRTSSSGTFRALAANCISMHRFRDAAAYLDSAMRLGDDRYATILQKIDVDIELGNYSAARHGLAEVRDDRAFEYLVRLARYKDHAEGKQAEAIALLEKARDRARELGYRSLVLWAESNLGDFYSHAGRLKEAYAAYLSVLKLDPEAHHSLKGIAWIAFSKDHNTGLARRILEQLQKRHPVPDYELMLGEIARFEGKTAEAQMHEQSFLAETGKPAYGGMYNKYRFFLLADRVGKKDDCYRLAQTEVEHRPTPEAYAWLAYGYQKMGRRDSSLYISRTFVEKRCFEPDAYYILGSIYSETGDKAKASEYLSLAQASAFELGPVTAERIAQYQKL